MEPPSTTDVQRRPACRAPARAADGGRDPPGAGCGGEGRQGHRGRPVPAHHPAGAGQGGGPRAPPGCRGVPPGPAHRARPRDRRHARGCRVADVGRAGGVGAGADRGTRRTASRRSCSRSSSWSTRSCKADAGWREAIAKRGVTDLDSVFVAPLSPGQFGHEERGRPAHPARRCRSSGPPPTDSPWAHPVDGLIAHVDIIERQVIKLIDTGVLPVPGRAGQLRRPAHVGPPRTTLKPMEITQPEGPSFTVEGDEVTWQNWQLASASTPARAWCCTSIASPTASGERPIIYRASIAEMVVPYGDPSPTRFWTDYFDSGEYLLGKQANSLELGCDCLGEIHYFDAVLADDERRAARRSATRSACTRRTTASSGSTPTSSPARRDPPPRRLVISLLRHDRQLRLRLLLVPLPGRHHPDGGQADRHRVHRRPRARHRVASHGVELAPGLGAPVPPAPVQRPARHDGRRRREHASTRSTSSRLPIGESNPYGNAFTRRRTPARPRVRGRPRPRTSQAARTWHVVNPERTNRIGQPVGYKLVTQQTATLLNAARLIGRQRGRCSPPSTSGSPGTTPSERYPAGNYPNQHRAAPGSGVDQGRPPARRPGHRAVAHLRRDPLPAHRGLAGDAGRVRGLHAQAGQLLRPQPRAGPAPQRQCARRWSQLWQLPLATQHGMLPAA